MWKRGFYIRDDIKDDCYKLRVYKNLFMVGFWLGLVLLVVSVVPPIVPVGIFAGSFSAIIGGYFLLSIRVHSGDK